MAVPKSVLNAVVDGLAGIHGLRLATPVANRTAGRPVTFDSLAVEVSAEAIELRVVALALPLLPVLHEADVALRAALAGTEWQRTPLRLVVTDIDAAAFDEQSTTLTRSGRDESG